MFTPPTEAESHARREALAEEGRRHLERFLDEFRRFQEARPPAPVPREYVGPEGEAVGAAREVAEACAAFWGELSSCFAEPHDWSLGEVADRVAAAEAMADKAAEFADAAEEKPGWRIH